MKVTALSRNPATLEGWGFVPHPIVQSVNLTHNLSSYGHMNPIESELPIPPDIVGTTVDYLTRFVITGSLDIAFPMISSALETARRLNDQKKVKVIESYYTKMVPSLNNFTIKKALNLVYSKNLNEHPDLRGSTIPDKCYTNIRTMVHRSVSFLKMAGRNGIQCGYEIQLDFTHTGLNVDLHGEMDYLTPQTIWDMKVSKYQNIRDRDILQLMCYWRLGTSVYHHYTITDRFENLKSLGIWNPRLSSYHLIYLDDISPITVEFIDDTVLQLIDKPEVEAD